MDAGLAAVIAGAAGAGGAALAAFATSFGLLRQARMQGDQAHRLWLRNHQQQAYEEFLVATDRAVHTSRDAVAAVRREMRDEHRQVPVQPETLALIEAVRDQARAVQVVGQRVALLADEETGNHGLVLLAKVLDVVQLSLDSGIAAAQQRRGSDDGLQQKLTDAVASRHAFIEQARRSLQST